MQGNMLLYFTFTLLLASFGEPARILGLFPFPGRSHFNSYSNLLDELAKRGHQVTVVSAFPKATPTPNYKDIAFEGFSASTAAEEFNMFERTELNPVAMMSFIGHFSADNCDKFLGYPQIQELIKSDQQFDLIIFGMVFCECGYGFMHKFKAPFILISPNSIAPWAGDGVGNPHMPSFVPDQFMGYTNYMSFKERLYNTLFQAYVTVFRSCYAIPRMESIMKKHFNDPTMPSIPEIEANASFLILNSHNIFHHPRPFTPNTAEVAGMHIRDPKKLPEDIQKFLDNAPNGVIYFSMGSHIRSVEMPEKMREAFLKTFAGLKEKVLWKWEDDTLPGQPKNVLTGKWLPQNDILGHPNVKLFLTHGGLMSTIEATYHGMPLVAVPVIGDQRINAYGAKRAGYAEVVEIQNVTVESLSWALKEVLTNPRYTENAKQRSRIFRDQPQKPLDKAVFWVEYVLRHKGAPHMKSAALKLNFFQYFVLDVIAVVLLVASIALAITLISCRALCRRLCSKSSKSKKVPQSKKNK